MNNKPFLLFGALIALAITTLPGFAEDSGEDAKEGAAEASERIRQALQARFGIDAAFIEKSRAPHMYEVFADNQLLYVSEDGRYLFQGAVLDMLTDVNLSSRSMESFERRLAPKRGERLATYPDDKTIVFAPEGDASHTITVATDVSCGYCRKFHREVGTLNEAGIAVRYLLFPRSGLEADSGSYKSMTSVWCNEDKAEALTRSKRGESIEPAECENPIAEHYQMSREMGVRGTPTIFTESGEKIGGYVPAAQLIETVKGPAPAP